MKILHTVQLYHPAQGGSEEVVKQLSERLAKRGHDVTVATAYNKKRPEKVINGVKIEEFNIGGNIVNGIKANKKEVEKYKKFILENNWDVIMNYAAQIWSTDLMFSMLEKIKAKKILVPCGYSALNNPKFKEYFSSLPEYLKLYDTSVYLSNNYQDKNFADNNNITNIAVIPNAASENEFLSQNNCDFKKKYNIKNDFLLTVANHYANKGHDFIIKTYQLCQTKNFDLVIIGNSVPRGCQKICRLKTWANNLKNISKGKIHLINIGNNVISRDCTVSAYKQAKIFIFGSRIECSPLVLFESMAAKLPFISTNCGNSEGIAKISGNKIITSPKEMANEIDNLCQNKIKYLQISEKGFNVWKNNFTWEKITDQYEKIYDNNKT